MELAPSILTANIASLGDDLDRAFRAGARRLHLDVMDGRFVPNISLGPLVAAGLREICDKHEAMLEAHLMIVEPERYIADFAEAGADLIAVHIEATPHAHRALQQIRGLGSKACIALNPATPLSAIEEVLDLCDQILVMTVNPGFGGQKLIPSTLDKVRRLRELLAQRDLDHIPIEVDGGINAQTIGAAVNAGAEVIVAGSAVFNRDASIEESIAGLMAGVK